MVWKLDRLGLSLPHLLITVTGLKERRVAFRSLTEQIDTTRPQGELLFHIFGALAQFERALIQERVQAGLAAARRRGRRGGRPVAIDAEKLHRRISRYRAEPAAARDRVPEATPAASLRRRATAELLDVLLPQAIEDDRLAFLAELVMQACRARGIVIPSAAALERLCGELRHGARREAHRRLTNGPSAEQRKRLDALTGRREESSLSWLPWLRQMPEGAKPSAMLGLIERWSMRARSASSRALAISSTRCAWRSSPARPGH